MTYPTLSVFCKRAAWLALFGSSLAISTLPAAEPAKDESSAQEDAKKEVVKLNAFQVSSDAYNGYIASSTMIGGKTAMKIIDVAQTINVVTRDMIDDMGSVDPNDALSKAVPGVSNFAGPGGVNATIRGFRAQNWSVDGATIRYLGMLTNFNYDAFEVIKGPASVTFGAFAAYGGYISMIPKNARRNHLNKLELSVGTDNFYSGMIDVGDEVGKNGDLQYRLVLGKLYADRPGFDYDFNDVTLVAPSFAYDFSEKSRITVRFEFYQSHQKLSTTALDANAKVIESFSVNGPENPLDRVNKEIDKSAQVVFTSQLNDQWSTRMNIMGSLGKKDYDYLTLIGQSAAPEYLIYPFQSHYWWKTIFADYSLSWAVDEVAQTGISNHMVMSTSIDHWDISYRIYDGNLIAPWNTVTLNPSNPDWNRLDYHFEYPTRYIYYNTEWLGGAVIEDRLGFFNNKLMLSAAARFNYDARSGHTVWRTPQTQDPNATYVGNPTPTNVNEKITLRYGAVYKPVDWLSIYGGYTEAFLAVGAIFKADGSRLQPETGANKELGVKLDMFQAFGGTFSASFAVFDIKVENKWRSDPINAGFFIQDGVQTNRGAEGQITFASEKFSGLIGAYKADGPTEKGTGLRAVLSPDETFNLWVKYNLTKKLSVGGGYKYVGDTVSNNRLYMTDPFFNIDLFASYTMPLAKGHMTYRLGVSNLTNELSVYRIDNAAVVYREDARRVKVTASYTW